MTLAEWEREHLCLINDFVAFWKKQNKVEYPPTLEPGEWDEQFQIWCSTHFETDKQKMLNILDEMEGSWKSTGKDS